jgi:hypothetical protein
LKGGGYQISEKIMFRHIERSARGRYPSSQNEMHFDVRCAISRPSMGEINR